MMECTRHILSTTCFPISPKDVGFDDQFPNKVLSSGIPLNQVEHSKRHGKQICECFENPPCLHFLAKTGQLVQLKEAFNKIENDEELLAVDVRGRTILHYASNFKGNPKMANSCVELITKKMQSRGLQILDCKDELGQTALYLGVKAENEDVCEALIRAGADWDIECDRGKSPVQKMFKKIPHIISTYFLQKTANSLKYANLEASDILVDFGTLIGYPTEEDIKQQKLSIYEETNFLSNLCYTPVDKRADILCHPLVKTFIYLKWQKIKAFFWISRVFQTVWALIYFWFLMEVYRKLCPYQTSQHYQFKWLGFIPIPLAANATWSMGNGESISISAEIINCRSQQWIEISAYLLLILAAFDLLYFEVHPTYIRFRRNWYPMKTVNPKKLFKQVFLLFKLLHLHKTLLLITMYLNVLPLLTAPIADPFGEWQYILASVGVFLTWLHIFLQIGKVPQFAVYIKMLQKVLATLGVITMIYISLIFAFAMVFCILLPGVPAYSSPFQAILKMSTFLIGEVEYEKFFYEEGSQHISASLSCSMFVYGVAILVLHIALLNFLIGLTVTDVQNIEKYTEVWRSFSHIWQISLFESFLSRCPYKIGRPWLRKISVLSANIPKYKRASSVSSESTTNGRNSAQLGSFEAFLYDDMTITIQLKDLPKHLSKELRELISSQKKDPGQSAETQSNSLEA